MSLMLLIKAGHLIAMVAWFAGLFYLPRLFVYHREAKDKISIERFQLMERRLYYSITYPAGIATSLFGLCLLNYNLIYYLHAPWMHAKLSLVVILWIYHLLCGRFLKQFKKTSTIKTSFFFRVFNEIPTILLIGIIMLVVMRPFNIY